MNFEQYTEDAVCFAMGLGQLVPTTPGDVVRLLCRPSFHPEVCVTVTPQAIVAVALHSLLWREPAPARMPELSERAALRDGEFDDICASFDRALAEADRPRRQVVVCDGMFASAVRATAARIHRYAGHPIDEAQTRFAKCVLSLALSRVESIPLRNRISSCGRYLYPSDDPAFPLEPEVPLPTPQVSRVLVLGTPEERADFHAVFGAGAATRRPK